MYFLEPLGSFDQYTVFLSIKKKTLMDVLCVPKGNLDMLIRTLMDVLCVPCGNLDMLIRDH